MADRETVSAIVGTEINHVMLTPTNGGWQASVGKGAKKGYTVAISADPGLALFEALHRAGATKGSDWRNPNPFRRLENALDRLIIALGNEVGQ